MLAKIAIYGNIDCMATVLVLTPEEVRDLVRKAVREELDARGDLNRDVLTAEEVAALLSVHPKTVTKLVTREGMPAHRLGREYRFSRSEITAWLEERAVKPGSQTARHAESLRRIKAA